MPRDEYDFPWQSIFHMQAAYLLLWGEGPPIALRVKPTSSEGLSRRLRSDALPKHL